MDLIGQMTDNVIRSVLCVFFLRSQP